jgi:hypothetical protein
VTATAEAESKPSDTTPELVSRLPKQREREPIHRASSPESSPVAIAPGAGSEPNRTSSESHQQSTETTATHTPRLLDEQRAAGGADRITVHLPDEAGGARIQVAVRGEAVHARIIAPDEAVGRELQNGLTELRSSLSRQGFQETHVRVDARPGLESGWAPAAASEAANAGDMQQQDSQNQERRERNREQESPRSDPRQQHQQGRSQQRARRERER